MGGMGWGDVLTLTAEPGLLWGQEQSSVPAALGRFPNGGWLRASCGSLAVGLGNRGVERGSKEPPVPGVGQDGVAALTGEGVTR